MELSRSYRTLSNFTPQFLDLIVKTVKQYLTCQKLIFASSNEKEARILPSGEKARAVIDDECAGIN